MKVSLSDAGVPFVVTYRKILKKPKMERRRVFVGPVQLARNLLLKVIEFIDDITYETKTEVLEPGHSVAVHWAVQIEDPWDVTPGKETGLIAFRMLDDMPPCGAHFEIISPPKEAPPEAVGELRPEDLQTDKGTIAQSGVPTPVMSRDGKFIRPPDPAYAARSVQPLVEEPLSNGLPEIGEEPPDEVPAHLDGAGGLGEDD